MKRSRRDLSKAILDVGGFSTATVRSVTSGFDGTRVAPRTASPFDFATPTTLRFVACAHRCGSSVLLTTLSLLRRLKRSRRDLFNSSTRELRTTLGTASQFVSRYRQPNNEEEEEEETSEAKVNLVILGQSPRAKPRDSSFENKSRL